MQTLTATAAARADEEQTIRDMVGRIGRQAAYNRSLHFRALLTEAIAHHGGSPVLEARLEAWDGFAALCEVMGLEAR